MNLDELKNQLIWLRGRAAELELKIIKEEYPGQIKAIEIQIAEVLQKIRDIDPSFEQTVHNQKNINIEDSER